MQNTLALHPGISRPRYPRLASGEVEDVSTSYQVRGVHGHLTLMKHRIIIARKPRLGFLGSFSDSNQKIIVLKNITAVQLKEAGAFSHCQIRFIVSRMVESEPGLLYIDPDEN